MPENVEQIELSPEDLMTEGILAAMPGDYAYIGAGSYSAAELELAFASKIALQAEIDDNLVQVGELAEKPQKVESKSTKLKTRNYLIPGKRETTIEVTLAGLGVKQKDWLESSEFSGIEHTMVCVSREMDRAVIFNGLRWIAQWSGESDGLFMVVLSTEVSQASSQVVMLSEIPDDSPHKYVDALFLDSRSATTKYSEAGHLVRLQNLSVGLGLYLDPDCPVTRAADGALLFNGEPPLIEFDSIQAKIVVACVTADYLQNIQMLLRGPYGEVISLCHEGQYLGYIDDVGLEMKLDLVGITDPEGQLPEKAIVVINTGVAPYVSFNGSTKMAFKDEEFGFGWMNNIGSATIGSFAGRLYGLFVSKENLTTDEMAMVVAWMKKRYGITGW